MFKTPYTLHNEQYIVYLVIDRFFYHYVQYKTKNKQTIVYYNDILFTEVMQVIKSNLPVLMAKHGVRTLAEVVK
jgi:hypothetical protein